MKINDILKTISIIFFIVLAIFVILEILARYKFKSYYQGSCPYEKFIKNDSIYVPKKNCKFSVKHWENDKEIVYETDENNNRVSTMPSFFDNDSISIAFFGDSFTWGDMNDVYGNYTHHTASTLKKLVRKKVGYSNYGVPGHDLVQILSRMKLENLKKYNYIIYGLTPNDIFSPQTYASGRQKNKTLTEANEEKKSLIKIITNSFRIHDIRSVKVAGKLFFDIFPKIYTSLYVLRDSNLAGYLSPESSPYWNERYTELFTQLKKLNPSIQNRLVIQIIPQRVQVLLFSDKNFERALAFENRVISICDKIRQRTFTLFSYGLFLFITTIFSSSSKQSPVLKLPLSKTSL